MNKKFYSLLGLVLCFVASANAQTLKEGYVEWGTDSPTFLEDVDAWNTYYSINNDDHFFVTRIKSKARFRNTATQVKTTLTDANDKRLLAWLPWEDDNVRGFKANALPTGTYDAEVFSMWSYVDHWGDWNAPLGRVPAALLDVAHKNGVAVSGTAGIPQSNITSSSYATWYNNLSADYGTKAANMLFYYGSSGFGYNSEFTGNTNGQQRVIAFHKALNKQLLALGDPNAESIWYDGSNDEGTNTFDAALTKYQGLYGTTAEPVLSVFGNYNTINNETRLANIVSNANSYGRSPLYFYGGMNIQGGQPSDHNWDYLKDYAVSIGLWGAHTSNMFFQNRYTFGTRPDQQQRTYLLATERWFGGGQRNPVLHTDATANTSHSAMNTSSPGMCSMMSARSTLQWDLSTEPFVTFFNLGNGTFFNWKGVRANNNDWANVGVQDYLPTWRYWFHTSWLGRTTSGVPSGIDAQFVWDDAYVGGSCLEISGTVSSTYLHLFKTKFALQNGDKITLRYKLMKGSADIALAMSAEGTESSVVTEQIQTTAQHFDQDLWVEKTFTVGSDGFASMVGKTAAVLALKIDNASDLQLYLGELSIVRGDATTPAAPNNLTTEVLYNGETGIDAKMIWEMPGKKTLPTATFNLDVNTSLFKFYSQTDDDEPVLLGITTSWAALAYRVPNNGTQVRLGVSAVSTDFASESAITWGDWIDLAEEGYEINDAIQSTLTTIKPDQEFTISYTDPKHQSATWQILNSSGTVVASGSGKSITASLSDVGVYTLKIVGYTNVDGVATANQTTTYENYITVSPESVGAQPEIYTLKINGQDPGEEGIDLLVDNQVTITYTARKSDGATSKAIDLNATDEFGFNYPTMKGITAADAKVSDYTSMRFTVTFWMKLLDDKFGSFFKMSDIAGDVWPHNNFCTYFTTNNSDLDATGAARKGVRLNIKGSGQSYVAYSNKGGTYSRPQNRMYFENTEIPVGQWVHVAIVFKTYTSLLNYYITYNSSRAKYVRSSLGTSYRYYGVDPEFYLNGVKQECTRYAVQSEYDHLIAASGEYALDLQGPNDTKAVYQSATSSTKISNSTLWHGFDAVSMPRTSGTILGIGGADRTGAVNAQIDHFTFWDTALSQAQILTTMEDISSTPSGLSALYSFENGLNSDNTIAPAYGSKSVNAGLYNLAVSGENSASYVPVAPTYVAGYPLLPGSTEVKTTATWNIPGADIISQSNSNTSSVKAEDELTGSVVAQWPMEGEREITLTLTNDYGSDSKTIKAVHVTDPNTGIDAITGQDDNVKVTANETDVLVTLPADGQYELRLIAPNGRLVSQKTGEFRANTTAVLHLQQQGVYILDVRKDGKTLPAIKFVKE